MSGHHAMIDVLDVWGDYVAPALFRLPHLSPHCIWTSLYFIPGCVHDLEEAATSTFQWHYSYKNKKAAPYCRFHLTQVHTTVRMCQSYRKGTILPLREVACRYI